MNRHLPHRGAPLYFALTFLTLGYFGLVWIFLMNRDIQKVHASHTPYLNRIALAAVLYPVSVGAHLYAVDHGFPVPVIFAIRAAVLVSWLATAWLLFGGVVSVTKYLREQHVQVPGNVALVALTLFFFLSLSLLQRRLNAMASRKEPTVTPSVVPYA